MLATANAGTATYQVVTSIGRAVGWTTVVAADVHAAVLVGLCAALRENPGRWLSVGVAYHATGDDAGTPIAEDLAPHAELRKRLAAAIEDGRIERKVTDPMSHNARSWYRYSPDASEVEA